MQIKDMKQSDLETMLPLARSLYNATPSDLWVEFGDTDRLTKGVIEDLLIALSNEFALRHARELDRQRAQTYILHWRGGNVRQSFTGKTIDEIKEIANGLYPIKQWQGLWAFTHKSRLGDESDIWLQELSKKEQTNDV